MIHTSRVALALVIASACAIATGAVAASAPRPSADTGTRLRVPVATHSAAATVLAPAAAPAVVLPDTGVFAPVAAQYEARRAELRSIQGKAAGTAAGIGRQIENLLETGQPEAAASLIDRTPPSLVKPQLRLRVLLARQDLAAARPLVAELRAQPSPDADSRQQLYAWLFASDDAPAVDSLSRAWMTRGGGADHQPDVLAAGKLAYDMLNYARAESCYSLALADSGAADESAQAHASRARVGLALVMQKRREWDASLAQLEVALADKATPGVLDALSETLIRLGRTDEAIRTGEWGIRLDPYHDTAHYLLGNGYARRNYTQLLAAYPRAFADARGRASLARADSLLAAGHRPAARAAYAALVRAHPGWADAQVRLASLDFEDGRFAESRDACFAALRLCPEYGRAHAVLAKALEAQRFTVDIHRPAYEARFAAAPMPDVPGIDKFVVNWASLSPRHQKRVALSIAPWKAFVPVLVAGGATFYIKPLYMKLSESPGQQTLSDQRISYDSRLWDDVRGCGGYHTVTGIEDVERTIFDRYNTVLHELTHQVHGVLQADDSRVIQEHYRLAKARDDSTRNGYLSRYAGGSVFEYFAEGANAIGSPKRDAYDPREVVSERLDAIDPDLRRLVESLLARTDVAASYPVAYAAGGDDRVSLGRVDEAIPLYRKALELRPDEETALTSYANALVLANRGAEAESVAARAVAAHPTSGPVRIAAADARWHAGRGLDAARSELEASRRAVRAEDRWQVDAAIGSYAWTAGDAARSLAAFDSVVAYQSDNPSGLRGRAVALALESHWDDAFVAYQKAVRMRTGIVDLRCDYARDLLRAGRVEAARAQLAEAALLEPENPTAEALRGWAELLAHQPKAARMHATQALAWGPWSDLARIVLGAVESSDGHAQAAADAWAPVLARMERNAPPEYVFRPKVATWEHVHALPAVERAILASFRAH